MLLVGRQEEHPACKKTERWGAGMVICLERGADLHMSSWCHCHSLSVASVKSRLVLPFWYRLTWVFPEKGPLNGCVCVCAQSVAMQKFQLSCDLLPAARSFHCTHSLETLFHMSLMQSTLQPMYLLQSNSYNRTIRLPLSITNHRTMHAKNWVQQLQQIQ